jgi:protein-disulfide isomerase
MQGNIQRPRLAILIDIGVLSVAALVIVSNYVRHGSNDAVRVSKEDWRVLVADGRAIGPITAQTTLVEFVDYQCPVCARLEPVVALLQQKNPTKIRRVIRHYPLGSIHEQAEDAAVVLECAGEQGRVEEMHSALLADQDAVSKSQWHSLAVTAQVSDLATFDACLRSPSARAKVLADRKLGDELGVGGTPTFLLDGEWLTGMSAPELRLRIQEKLR